MSLEVRGARGEQVLEIELALMVGDSDTLRTQAAAIKKEGEDEWAEALMQSADRIDQDHLRQDEYDELKAERDAERMDSYFAPSEGF